MTPSPQIHWVSANSLIEEQTRQIAKEFGSSRPRPRNRQMGFKGEVKKAKRKREEWGADFVGGTSDDKNDS